jgi:propane monooxygenase small subunit
LVGELFRSNLVQQAAPGNGDFVTPTIIGAAEFDYAQRDLRYTTAMFELLTNDKEFAGHNKAIMNGWLSTWVEQCIDAARTLQPLWSQPDSKPPRFEDGLDRAKSRFSELLNTLGLDIPKELDQ